MAFQDFDMISERRRNENRLKTKKKILIGVVSAVLLACVIGAAAFVVVQRTGSTGKQPTELAPSTISTHVDQNSKMVKMICATAVYKDKCESTLGEALKKDMKLAQPKDLIMVSMILAENEVSKIFDETAKMDFATPQEKDAYSVCQDMLNTAKQDLEHLIADVHDSDSNALLSKGPKLNNYLSGVMTYQQTCLDNVPDGKLKDDLSHMFKNSKELISNCLAVLTQFSSFFSIFQGASTFNLPWKKPAGAAAAHAPASAPGAAPGAASNSSPASAPGAAPVAAPGPVPSSFDAPPIPAWSTPIPTWAGPADFLRLDDKPTPNVTVAQDGSGDFKTISEALAAVPKTYEGRYVVYVKEGVYDELVTVTRQMINMTMYGDGRQKSIITGNKNYVDGVRTFQTASFVVLGDGFVGKDMGFRNTAGAIKHQAVAARIQADAVIFFNCDFDGYQDTLYAQTHRQFYRDCTISGTIDFIFGDASAVFQNCTMLIRKPLENQQNIVTAQGRLDKQANTGFVLQKCVIKAHDDLVATQSEYKNYLGRPWKEFSRTIIMETEIDGLIHPDGFLPWEGNFALDTLYYGEYNNNGAGSSTAARVHWPGLKVILKDEATTYTVEAFLEGTWINGTGVPAHLGMYT